MKKVEDAGSYPFEWMDEMISIKLNPARTAVGQLSRDELASATDQLSGKTWELLNFLKVRTFGKSEKKVRIFVQQYRETIRSLITRAKSNLTDSQAPEAVALTEKLIAALEDLLRDVELRYHKHLPSVRLRDAVDDDPKLFKVLCQLSVDQLGILIKAADDIKLILSRSLSLIFRSLVPYLSTERTKNISWMSMRKSTYQFERTDLDLVVELLERMIKKVKDYY